MGEPISPSSEDLEGLPEEALAGLIAKGRAQGSLTDADVFFALPDVEPSPAQLEAIFTHIRASGIPVEEISADFEAEDDDLAPVAPVAAGVAETVPAIPIPLIVPIPIPIPIPVPVPEAEPETAAAAQPLAKARRAPRQDHAP
ncbi:MAG TPA: RNA polymerase sigma factor region1.1 domain-containing protein, partial [Acidimicrobiia bacterium]|nr:RNA polymerase sigma factor region1.1 domain-containing protein [Acidimicrobiia bacterium]